MLGKVRSPLVLLLALVSACNDAVGDTPRPASSDAAVDAGSAAGGEAGSPRRPGVLRVATFNVHRYFDTICDSGSCTAGAFEEVPTDAAFERQTAAIAGGIERLDADVIALQEIENLRAMSALRDRLAKDGFAYATAEIGETGAPASVDVAIFARAPQAEVRTHRNVPLTRPDGSATTFSRELLELRMTFGARRVVFFAAHFRSKVDDDPGRRYAEAVAARDIVSAAAKEEPDALVVLGGDLNDEPGSPPVDALEQGGALVRVAKDLPPAEQATFVFSGRAISIDHLFVAAGGASRYVAKSALVVRDGAAGGGLGGSDHAALQADFALE